VYLGKVFKEKKEEVNVFGKKYLKTKKKKLK
jgi:hypothetical protein